MSKKKDISIHFCLQKKKIPQTVSLTSEVITSTTNSPRCARMIESNNFIISSRRFSRPFSASNTRNKQLYNPKTKRYLRRYMNVGTEIEKIKVKIFVIAISKTQFTTKMTLKPREFQLAKEFGI